MQLLYHKTCNKTQNTQCGNEEEHYDNRPTIKTNNKNCTTIQSYTTLSERVALLLLISYPRDIIFIQLYAPTSAERENEFNSFCSELKQFLQMTTKVEISVILRHLHAKVGEGKVGNIFGDWKETNETFAKQNFFYQKIEQIKYHNKRISDFKILKDPELHIHKQHCNKNNQSKNHDILHSAQLIKYQQKKFSKTEFPLVKNNK